MGNVACVFTFFKGNGPAACKEAYDFCYNVCGARPAWPLLGLYYKHWNGKELKAGYSLGNSPNVPAFKSYVTSFLSQVNKLKKDEPEPDPEAKPPEEEVVPGDATFACGNNEKARLEAMPSTEQVYVPVIKTQNLDVETTNQVVVIGIPTPDATNAAIAVTNEIVWTAETNATSLVQEIPVPKSFWASNTNWTGAAAITVELRATNGVLNAKTAITLVEEQPASPLFPKWIGENFGFGEWTLDFDAATNKVFAANTEEIELSTNLAKTQNYEAVVDVVTSAVETVPVSLPYVTTNVIASTYVTNVVEELELDLDFFVSNRLEIATLDEIVTNDTGIVTNSVSTTNEVAVFLDSIATNLTFTTEHELDDRRVFEVADLSVSTNVSFFAEGDPASMSTIFAETNTYTFSIPYTNVLESTGVLCDVRSFTGECTTDIVWSNATTVAASESFSHSYTNKDYEASLRSFVIGEESFTFNLSDSNNWDVVKSDGFRFTIRTNVCREVTLTNCIYEVATNSYDFEYSNTLLFTNPVTNRFSRSFAWDGVLYTNTLTVASDDVASYTLVMVGGGLWCSDCKSCKESLVGKSEFTAWAKSNNVALVVSDQPERDTEAASLVTHNIGKMDASSGSYYLSRKGLTIAQGSEQFAVMTNRSYNLWKKDQTEVRVANPTFILFRNDGTIAGRLQESRIEDPRVADNKEEYSLEENLARLNDLLKMAKDSTANGLTEEANDALETTPLEIAFEGESSEVTLQVNDVCDYVRVTGLPSETYFDLDLDDVPEVCSNANFKAELMVWDGSDYVELTPKKQNTWKMSVEQASTNVYLKFSAYEDARYTLYGSNTALSVGFSMLKMQPDAGEIALTETGAKIVEGQKTNIVISAKRSIWHSGSVTGYLHVVPSETTAQPYRFGWPTNSLGEYVPQALVWEDGELGIKNYSLPLLNDPVWDGDEKITVRLEAVGEVTAENGRAVSIAAGAGIWELTIYEDDPKESGKIALSPENSEPAATKQNIVFAKENTTVKLAVERIDGSNGEASVCLSATGGTLLDERLTWSSKDIENVKYARFVLPALKSGQSQATCYVTLKKDCDVPLVSSASRIQIRVLPSDAPVFTSDLESCAGVQSVKMEKIIYLNSELPEGAVVTLSRISGSIPAGVTVRYDKDLKAIVISGIPSGYGDFLASYQLIVRAGGNVTYSMPVTVDFNLASRAEIVPALAKACAFTDLPVLGSDGKTLEGLLDVTLPVSGRLSAKYRTIEGKSVALTANGWNGIADKTASAEFSAKSGYRMVFNLSSNNSVKAEIVGPGFTNYVDRPAVPLWSTDNKASGYQGVYTLEIAPTNTLEQSAEPLCTGALGVSLKLNTESAYRTGRMIFTGILPNGKAVNGTSTLIPSMAGTFAEMPLFAASSSDAVSGIILVTNGLHQTHTNGNLKAVRCRQDVDMVWLHIEPRLPASYSYGVDCSVWGTYLPSGMDWGERWQRDFGTSNLWFAVDGTAERTCLIASGKTVKIKDVKQNPLNLTFSLNASTGIARGTVRVEGRTYSWSGAFLGDWHECGSCGNEVETTRPLLFGNFWTQVLDTYTDDAGYSRKASIHIGGAVMIDKLENLESN